jgi:Zn finger protein HypA/HybF involved in hydrogenase expression
MIELINQQCEKCQSENLEVIDNKKEALKLFLLGAVLFPLFWLFWPMALVTALLKRITYKCKDCKKTFSVKIDNTVKG